jgi:hypothetical protein
VPLRITDEQRRARLAVRHRLIADADGPVEVARSVVALHSSDPGTVFLSIQARSPDKAVSDIERALYEDRTLIRHLGMRRTMWVVPTDFAATIDSSSTRALVDGQRKRLAAMFEETGVADDGMTWYEQASEEVIQSLRERGEATAREITEDVPRLSRKMTFHKKDGSVMAVVGVSTRVLFMLATEGRICRSRPLGTWISSQYRWTTVENWMGSSLPVLDRSDAQVKLLDTWLPRFGPATETDIKWWTGWPVTQIRHALARLGAVEAVLDCGAVGYLHPEDTGPVDDPGPWVALLPSLDPTTMGWKERDWYLGAHADQLFDRNGNAGPTVWADGRVVGGWAQRKSGEVVFDVLEDIGTEATAVVEEEVQRLEAWIGDIVVTPRFRTPLEKALTA